MPVAPPPLRDPGPARLPATLADCLRSATPPRSEQPVQCVTSSPEGQIRPVAAFVDIRRPAGFAASIRAHLPRRGNPHVVGAHSSAPRAIPFRHVPSGPQQRQWAKVHRDITRMSAIVPPSP